MKRWPIKPLGELSETVMGQAPPGGECNSNGIGTPFVKAGEFGKSHPIIREWTTKPLKLAKTNDVLVCVVGATCGKLNLGADCAIGRSVAAIRPDEKLLNTGFLYAFLQGWTKRLRSGSQGSAQGVITRDMLASIPIPAPPLAEQERIVKLLDEADELRKLRAQADHRTIVLIPALFHEMFGDPARNERQWPVLKFGELAADTRNGINPPKSQFGSGVPFVTVNNLYDGLEISTKNLQSVAISIDEEAKYKLLPGDICFSRSSVKRNGVGMPSIFAASSPAVFGGFVIRVRVKSELNPVYACSFFLLPSTRKRVIDASNSGTITNISQPSLLGIEVPVPPLPLQQEFAQRVTELRELEAGQTTSRIRLDALFQSMLHRAFNGEL